VALRVLPLAAFLWLGAALAPGTLRPFRIAAAVTLAGGALLSLKRGSYVYYYWEAAVACAPLACVAVATLQGRRRIALGLAAGAMLAVSAAQLAPPGRFSRVDLLSDAQERSGRERAAFVTGLPAPVLSEDRLLALPWYGGQGAAAPVLDPILMSAPLARELLGDGPLPAVRAGTYRSVLVRDGDRFGLASAAIEAGLLPAPLPDAFTGYRLFLATDGASTP
jgi:hypothetical protein